MFNIFHIYSLLGSMFWKEAAPRWARVLLVYLFYKKKKIWLRSNKFCNFLFKEHLLLDLFLGIHLCLLSMVDFSKRGTTFLVKNKLFCLCYCVTSFVNSLTFRDFFFFNDHPTYVMLFDVFSLSLSCEVTTHFCLIVMRYEI